MPRQSATVVENSFIKGLITEATGLNFPEKACVETFNCVFEKTGKVTRRKGFDYQDTTVNTVARDDSYITEYYWDAVGGDGDLNFIVVQIGSTLYYYKVVADGILADQIQAFTTDLNDYLPAGSARDAKDAPCQFASGKGYLFVSNRNINPFFVSYDADAVTISETEIAITIRDFEGVDDGLEIDERPSSITDAHRYNLYNQGWGATGNLETLGSYGIVFEHWDSTLAYYPSNADIWWTFVDGDGAFDLDALDRTYLGNSPAPKGHYILDAFNQDREGALEDDTGGAHTIADVTAGNRRPSTIAFFAGRVFYAGVDSQGFNDKIYFTQIIERDSQIGECYQLNDPTSEHQSDLLPSDGGQITLTEAGTIYKLIPIQEFLLVFCSNGVWSIGGSEGFGFQANDYAIQKVSTIGCRSATSFVMVNGLPIWWNPNGIYTIAAGQQGALTVESISSNTIQSFFDDIPVSCILKAKGAYNPRTKIVQWIYRAGHVSDVDDQHDTNRILNLNTETGAFYPWSFLTSSVVINGIVCVENPLATAAGATDFYYLCSAINGANSDFTWATCTDEDYLDWTTETTTGQNYSSNLITGYSLYGEGDKDFQSNYVTVHLVNEDEEMSVLMRGMWDYSKVSSTDRWSTQQQCYRFADIDDYGSVQARLKVRGRGKALQLRFDSEQGLPFSLAGWSIVVSSNASV